MPGLFSVQSAEQILGGFDQPRFRHIPFRDWRDLPEDLDGGLILVSLRQGGEGV
jgi:hypothetical protein